MNLNIPEISIIVPIYNVEKYLKECLDSLINQTFKNLEIICVNDGSTDSCPQILEEYALKDSRIKVINKANSGYGASMNIGLEKAVGKYIGIIESDDLADINMFKELYKIAQDNDADIVKSDFYYYFSSKQQARKAGIIKHRNINKVMSVKDDVTMLNIMPTIWSAIYKKSFLEENNIKFLETAGASYQDTSFAFKTLSSAKRIIFTNNAYVYYRQDNASSSVKSKAKVYAICDEWEEITRYIEQKPDIKKIVNDIKLSTQFNSYKWTAAKIYEQYREEFITKFKETFIEYLKNNEIKKGFYKKVKAKELEMLINKTERFKIYIDKLSEKQEQKLKRQGLFSIRINSSRISIILFGKQIVEIG